MDSGFPRWLIAGILAKWTMPGKNPGGIIVTILVATAGAILLLRIPRQIKSRSA